MIRLSFLLLVLLFTTGCNVASSVIPESPYAKAVREDWRESVGDGEPIEIVKVHAEGKPADYLVRPIAVKFDSVGMQSTEYRQCTDAGIAVPVTTKVRGLGGPHEQTTLFIIEGGKVAQSYSIYKRK
ncbi:hypothetical protein ETAA8_06560 [Anatilimnocola aggregata]|uniref:Lipoprotein n=1 Tax=Anatilimnocola aggregata TaxID=2528021 RepID=A0A517Y5V3_9BACT|nr:hypothetical protein [Anatilimnocola aggregata]QDU25586.1 hypothetical protein ETAA8_06560 [Anatilimnocola aggregata]